MNKIFIFFLWHKFFQKYFWSIRIYFFHTSLLYCTCVLYFKYRRKSIEGSNSVEFRVCKVGVCNLFSVWNQNMQTFLRMSIHYFYWFIWDHSSTAKLERYLTCVVEIQMHFFKWDNINNDVAFHIQSHQCTSQCVVDALSYKLHLWSLYGILIEASRLYP